MSTLLIDEFGCFIGKSGDLIQVRKSGQVLLARPIDELSCVTVEGRGISLSVDVVHELAQRGIPIDFVAFDGEPYAKLLSPLLTATVETRREQLLAFEDHRGVEIAKDIISAKLGNQRSLLLYFAKYRKKADPDLASELAGRAEKIGALAAEVDACSADRIDDCRPALLNLEGRAGALYWEAVWRLLPPDVSPGKREHAGATDPTNCMLNYGYGILMSHCWTAVLLAGLDPFGGFIHVDRPGKPSLVLDLQEVFRQPVVDRTVISLLNKGFRLKFEEPGRIEKDSRRRLAAAVLERLGTLTDFHARRMSLDNIIVAQARALCVAVRGEKPLGPFRMKW